MVLSELGIEKGSCGKESGPGGGRCGTSRPRVCTFHQYCRRENLPLASTVALVPSEPARVAGVDAVHINSSGVFLLSHRGVAALWPGSS